MTLTFDLFAHTLPTSIFSVKSDQDYVKGEDFTYVYMYSPKKEILLLTKVTAYPNTPTLCNLSKYEPNDQDQVFFYSKNYYLDL